MLTERFLRAAVRRRSTVAMLAWSAVVLVGCERRSRFETAHLAGAVSIDGVGVPQGKLVLFPLGTGQGPVVGVAIAQGRYDCPYAPLGKVRVQIYANHPTGRIDRVMGADLPELVDVVPERYRNGIEIEIFGDDLGQNFALESSANGVSQSAAGRACLAWLGQ